MEAILLLLGVTALIAASIVYGSFSWGFVLYKFWYWFVLPVFTAAPHIGFLEAVGLSLVVSLLKSSTRSEKLHSNQIKLEYKPEWGIVLIAPWVAFLSGWLTDVSSYPLTSSPLCEGLEIELLHFKNIYK